MMVFLVCYGILQSSNDVKITRGSHITMIDNLIDWGLAF
jgi:hypothetical protein